jgi:hypothetical protein
MMKIILSFVNYPIGNRYLIIYILTINKEFDMRKAKKVCMSVAIASTGRLPIEKYAVYVGSVPDDWKFVTMVFLPSYKRVDVYFSKRTGDWWVTRYFANKMHKARITDVNSLVTLLTADVLREIKHILKEVRIGRADISQASLFVGTGWLKFSMDANNNIYAYIHYPDKGVNVAPMMLGTLAKVKIDDKLLKRLIANYCIGKPISLT